MSRSRLTVPGGRGKMARGRPKKMKLTDLVYRASPPAPWAEGEKIPWHDAAFSERMLAEHLSQAHDAASRRFEKIDEHVRWIHGELLGGRRGKVLDLGCGPGLYTHRLARLGHECVGIDFGPASIAYASQQATDKRPSCTYHLGDIRRADYGSGFALAMLIFGEFCVFRPAEAGAILAKARAALDAGGLVLLEPHTHEAVRRMGGRSASWQAREAGLFSDRPHLYLAESFWDEPTQTSTTRCYVIDAATGEVTAHASTAQAYRDEQLRAVLVESGFEDVRFFPSLTGAPDASQVDYSAVVARRCR